MRSLLLLLSVCLLSGLGDVYAQTRQFRFNENGEFKVAQFTDVHYIQGKAKSQESLDMIRRVLETEKPDLAVLTGDIVTGKPAEEGWKEVTAVFEQARVPYVVTLGNHDSEQELTNEQIIRQISPYTFCMNQHGTHASYGCANGVITIQGNKNQKPEALLFYLNSNGYSYLEGVEGYGWIEPEQIDWFRERSAFYKGMNQGTSLPSLVFFHIPLPEHTTALGSDRASLKGTRLEKECSPQLNSGMFINMLKAGGVLGAFTGHDHNNDYVAMLHGIALGYGRFSGSRNTYQELQNGSRIFVLQEGKQDRFTTWIRLADGSLKNQVQIEKGKIQPMNLEK